MFAYSLSRIIVVPPPILKGYFSDRSIMSRLFVKENMFYQIMNVWGCVYYSDAGYNFIRYGMRVFEQVVHRCISRE